MQRSEIQFGVNDDAGSLTLTLSGVDDEIMNRVRNSETEFYQRPIIIWGQFFDEALQIQGDRFQLFGGTMDVPTYGGTGPGERSVTISCESEWADRNGSKFEFFSQRSQTKRFAGDLGLEYVYRYLTRRATRVAALPVASRAADRIRPVDAVLEPRGGNPVRLGAV